MRENLTSLSSSSAPQNINVAVQKLCISPAFSSARGGGGLFKVAYEVACFEFTSCVAWLIISFISTLSCALAPSNSAC